MCQNVCSGQNMKKPTLHILWLQGIVMGSVKISKQMLQPTSESSNLSSVILDAISMQPQVSTGSAAVLYIFLLREMKLSKAKKSNDSTWPSKIFNSL